MVAACARAALAFGLCRRSCVSREPNIARLGAASRQSICKSMVATMLTSKDFDRKPLTAQS